MKQPKVKLSDFDSFVGGIENKVVKVLIAGGTDQFLHIGSGKSEKKAYKAAAKKLRKLADAAEKMA